MSKLLIIGKNIHLNVAEMEWLGAMQKMYNLTEQEALAEIIEYKREQAFGYKQKGLFELERHLLMEIDEWSDLQEEEFKDRKSDLDKRQKEVTIILPGGK